MSINYIFRYHGQSDKIYSDAREVFEEEISDKLEPLSDQTKIQINSVILDFDYEAGHDVKYKLVISVDSPKIDFVHEENDKDPRVIVHKCVDSLLRYVRKEKDKMDDR
jgi:ribosome-associated translation inhibitor RaiA